MAQKKIVGAVAGLVLLAGVFGALALVLSDPAPLTEDDADVATATDTESDAATDAEEETERTERTRLRSSDQAAVSGEVRRRSDDSPVAGQRVVLLTPDGSSVESVTGPDGTFQLDELAQAEGYELRVAAEGFATVRLPSLGLVRKETLDVGTLWLDKAIRVPVVVMDLAGRPIEGARVEAFPVRELNWAVDWNERMARFGERPTAVDTVTTDGEGAAAFPELPTGTWFLVATHQGHATVARRSGELLSEDDIEPIEFHLGRSFTLGGRVVDAELEPLSGVRVLVGSANMWTPHAAASFGRATTDAEGRYEVDGLDVGQVTVYAATQGAVPTQVAQVKIPELETLDVQLIQGGLIRGRVTDAEGKPLAGVAVRATGWNQGGTRIGSATTDADGRYAIDSLLEGFVNQFTVRKDGYVEVREGGMPGFQAVAVNRDGVVTKDFVMRPAATLVGRVVDTEGNPVAGAGLIGYSSRMNQGVQQINARSGPDGRFSVDAVEAGTWMFVVQRRGYYQKDLSQNFWAQLQTGNVPEEFSVEVEEEGEFEKELVLHRTISISGTVVDSEGKAIEGAQVTGGAQNQGWGGSQSATARTDADGRFELAGFRPSMPGFVRATHDDYSAGAKTFQMGEEEPDEPVELELAPLVVVRGTVTTADGTALPEGRVTIAAPNQAPDFVNVGWGQGIQQGSTTTAPIRPDGTYEARIGISQGSFVVTARVLGYADTRSDPVEIGGGETEFTVDVRVERGRSIAGLVRTRTGQPIAGARISVSRGNGSMQVTSFNGMVSTNQGPTGPIVATSDAEGRFTLDALDDGEHTVQATAFGYVAGSAKAKLPGTDRVTIELDPELELAGVVRFSDGSPVAGAQLNLLEGNQNPRGGMGMPGMTNSTVTAENGAFTFRGLGRGQYRIQVTPPWGAGGVNVRPFQSEPLEAGRADVELTARRGLVIAGRVVDGENQPVVGTNVQCNGQAAGGQHVNRWTQTDADGRFELNGLDDGSYTVNAGQAWGGGSDYRPVVLTEVAPGTTDLRITLLPGLAISGVLLDEQGDPVANRMLLARATDPQRDGNWHQTTTDAKGAFRFGGLSDGDYAITSQQGWGGNQGTGVVEGGSKIAAGSTNLRLVFGKGVTITGRVVAADGSPVTSGGVNAYQPQGGNHNSSAQLDQNGEFEISGLADGVTYHLNVWAQGFQQRQMEGVEAGATGVEIVLERGLQVTGRVLDADGDPLANTQLMFRPEGHAGSHGNSRTDADGNFTADGLSEGKYTVMGWRSTGTGMTQLQLGSVVAGDRGVELRANEE